MFDKIRNVYELYGFDELETSAFEYADALGKFLPDQDRPNEGVFSFLYDDNDWVSLRYDLTAPLARFVAENYDQLPKPFRRYQSGPVWRNEKPGPGRFRQFYQFDADTVGTESMAADAEICMLMADVMSALGFSEGDFEVRVNNRKILDGVLEKIGFNLSSEQTQAQRLTVLRAIDKLDRLGSDGVRALLGAGRKDESGAFTKGAELEEDQISAVLGFLESGGGTRMEVCDRLAEIVGDSELGQAGVEELREIADLHESAGAGESKIVFDPSIVRGLEYYTGPVWEIELTLEAENEAGEATRFGSVGSGGRYDGLVERFKGVKVPATGCSIGVSRLLAALEALGKVDQAATIGPVTVLVMDRDRLGDYQQMVQELRSAGIRSEMYVGTSGMRAQVKYADKRKSPVAVIVGEDERNAGEVTLKDLILGERMSQEIEDNKTWREDQPAQLSVKREDLVEGVRSILSRYDVS